MARTICPICGCPSPRPLPRGVEDLDEDWPHRVEAFGALWDASDDWLCPECGYRWPHAVTTSLLNFQREVVIPSVGTSGAGSSRKPGLTREEEVRLG